MNANADPIADRTARAAANDDRWLILRHRLRIDGAGALFLGACFYLAVTLLTVAVANITQIRISGWESSTQLVRWFIGAMGAYLTAVYLPLYVTHGRTRHEVARQWTVFGILYAALVGVLIAVGFALEGLVHRIAGWPQTLDASHLFSAPDQYHLIVFEHALLFAVWLAGGALVGAAFYRHGGLGMAAIPVAIAAAVLGEFAVGSRLLRAAAAAAGDRRVPTRGLPPAARDRHRSGVRQRAERWDLAGGPRPADPQPDDLTSAPPPLTQENRMTAITVDALHKRYGDTVAMDDVSFEVAAGEVFGILGRNGAGKTTTVESIAGLRRPDRGRVRVLGLDPQRDRSRVTQVLTGLRPSPTSRATTTTGTT